MTDRLIDELEEFARVASSDDVLLHVVYFSDRDQFSKGLPRSIRYGVYRTKLGYTPEPAGFFRGSKSVREFLCSLEKKR